MSDPSVFAAAIVTVLVAAGGVAVTVITAITKAKKELLDAAKEIHTLVNGSATVAAAKLVALENQITALNLQLGVVQDKRVDDAKAREAHLPVPDIR